MMGGGDAPRQGRGELCDQPPPTRAGQTACPAERSAPARGTGPQAIHDEVEQPTRPRLPRPVRIQLPDPGQSDLQDALAVALRVRAPGRDSGQVGDARI